MAGTLEDCVPAFCMKCGKKAGIMKRFHGQNDDINGLKMHRFNEAMHFATENYEKISKNTQKTLAFLWRL